ncbi:MAG: hypothetical protein WB626_10115, partial [Bacteroidota bacterium]
LTTAGVSWASPGGAILLSAEVEWSNQETVFGRAGVEISPVRGFSFRTGVDRVDLSETGTGMKPGFGFTAGSGSGSWHPVLNYAYVVEPFIARGLHVVTLSVSP